MSHEDMTGLVIGVVFIVPTLYFIRRKRWDSLAWPLFLVTLPIYYMLFGVLASDGQAVLKELLYGLPYIATGLLVWRIRSARAAIVIALAWISHGVYDMYHDVLFVNPGVFSWYPAFCAFCAFCAFVDIVVGGYILISCKKLAAASYTNEL